MFKFIGIIGAIILTLIISISSILAFHPTVSAVDVLNGNPHEPCANGAAPSAACQDNNPNGSDPISGPNGILTAAINVLAYIVGAASIIVIIIGGLRMVISSGDPNAVSSSRSAILYALIGLAVAAVAKTIVSFIISKA